MMSVPSEYTEGVYADGAAILRDGVPVRISELLTELNRVEHLKFVMRECCDCIRDNDEFSALRMLEVALTNG